MGDLNYNLAINVNFKMEIAGAPEFNYFIQQVNLPGLEMAGIETPYKNNQAFMPSNRIDYDPLNINYLVSEDFSNYIYMYNWMRDIMFDDYPKEHFRDMTLHVLNNNKLKNLQVKFYGCFPTSLMQLDLESAVADTNPLMNTVMIRYQYFEIVRK